MQRLSLALANLVDALAPEQRKKLADAFRTAAPETLEAVVDQAWTPSDATFNALKKAGKTSHMVYYGEQELTHAFPVMHPFLPQSIDAVDRMTDWFEQQAELERSRGKEKG